jgi:hypothetical protein
MSTKAMLKELANLGNINYAQLNIPRDERRDKTETNTAIQKTIYQLSAKYESTSAAFGYAPVTGNDDYRNKDGSVNTGYIGCHKKNQVRQHL